MTFATTNPTPARYDNNEPINGSYSTSSVAYVNDSLGSSTDPFDGKTNKYAETSAVRIQASTKAIWVKWSTDGTDATAGTGSEDYIAAEDYRIYNICSGYKYLRIIENAASATSIVVEMK